MKKIILFFMFIVCLFAGSQAHAQSYVDITEVNLANQSISGVFLRPAFVQDVTDANTTIPASLEFVGEGGTSQLITTFPIDTSSALLFDDQDFQNIFQFNENTGFLVDLQGNAFNGVRMRWQNTSGADQVGDTVLIANFIQNETPLVTNEGAQIPELTVSWDTPFLKNTNPDNSGHWYYEIKTTEPVVKDVDGDAYLILMKTNKGDGVKTPIVLGSYLAGTGLSFPVTYPSCTDLNCSEIAQSGVEYGYDYRVYFSYHQNGSSDIHSDAGDGKLTLPDLPAQVTSADGFITIEDTSFVTDPESGSTYIEVRGEVLQDVEGDYRVFVTAKDNDGSRNPVDYELNLIPGISGAYLTPTVAYPMDNSFDTYEISIQYDNATILSQSIDSNGTVSAPSGGGGSLSAGFSADQQSIIENGIVPHECGYDIGPSGSGRACGFADVVKLIQNVIEYIFILVLPISAIVFAYAGFLLLSSGGNSSKKDAAKNAMKNVIIGIVIIMLAWLIVKTILVSLGASDGFFIFLDINN